MSLNSAYCLQTLVITSSSTAPVKLPTQDDGLTLLLYGLSKGWGPARVQAYVERAGVKAAAVQKAQNAGQALVSFSSNADRHKFCTFVNSGKEGIHYKIGAGGNKGEHKQDQHHHQQQAVAGQVGATTPAAGAGDTAHVVGRAAAHSDAATETDQHKQSAQRQTTEVTGVKRGADDAGGAKGRPAKQAKKGDTLLCVLLSCTVFVSAATLLMW